MQKITYIVRARDDNGAPDNAIDKFLAAIRDERSVELVNAIGPEAHPHTLIVAIAPDQTAAFEQRVRAFPQLIIERDRKLSLFD